MTERVQVLVKDVPPEIRKAAEREAANWDRSRNDIVGEILARRYGLDWDSTAYPNPETSGDAENWILVMPERLREVIRAHALAVKGTMRGVILLALADYYGLPAQSPRKRRARHGRPRGRRGAAA
jgi:hypothetical protein